MIHGYVGHVWCQELETASNRSVLDIETLATASSRSNGHGMLKACWLHPVKSRELCEIGVKTAIKTMTSA